MDGQTEFENQMNFVVANLRKIAQDTRLPLRGMAVFENEKRLPFCKCYRQL